MNFGRLAAGFGLGLGALAGGFGIFSMIGQGDGPIDAAYVWYTPEDPMDWTASGGPGEVAPALDELSERLTDLDGTGTDGCVVRWDGTKGLQDSHIACLDNGNLTTDSDAWAIYGHNNLAGHGGSLTITGGAGINYGHDGGDLTFRGGCSVYGTPGTLICGDANTSAVNIGAAGVPINITGTQTWTGTITNYDAQTVLAAVADNTPTAISFNEQTLLGRLTGGNVAAVSIGIADNNIVQVDHDSGAGAGDYAKFTAGGLEGRSYEEVRTDLNVENGATADQTGAEMVTAINGESGTPIALGGTPGAGPYGHWYIIEVDESDFTGGSNQETEIAFVLPAGGVIEAITCRVTEQPVQGGMATCVVEIGVAGSNKYTAGATWNWNQAVDSFAIYGPVADNCESYSGSTNITVKMSVTGLGSTTGGLTAGTFDLAVKVSGAI